MRKLIAYLTGGTPVCLRSHRGKVYKTIMYKDPFGCNYAPVYWFPTVGHCILLENGDISDKSEASYIDKWIKG